MNRRHIFLTVTAVHFVLSLVMLFGAAGSVLSRMDTGGGPRLIELVGLVLLFPLILLAPLGIGLGVGTVAGYLIFLGNSAIWGAGACLLVRWVGRNTARR